MVFPPLFAFPHSPLLPSLSFFFFNDTATTEIYTLSLHDALPIFPCSIHRPSAVRIAQPGTAWARARSEEHTSELQSHLNLVCRLLLEKKKKTQRKTPDSIPPWIRTSTQRHHAVLRHFTAGHDFDH